MTVWKLVSWNFQGLQVFFFLNVWCVDCGIFKLCIIHVVVIVKRFYCGRGRVVAICYTDVIWINITVWLKYGVVVIDVVV